MKENTKMSKLFFLTSCLLAKPQQPVNIFRATSEEELIKLVQRESRVNAESNIPEWVPTSQLAVFAHPSILAEQGIQVVTEIPVSTKEEWLEFCRVQAEEQWAEIDQIPTALDRYVTDEERGFALPDDSSDGAPDTSFMLPEDSGVPIPAFFVKHPDDSYTAADPQPLLHVNAEELIAGSATLQPTYYVVADATCTDMVEANPQPVSKQIMDQYDALAKAEGQGVSLVLPDGIVAVSGSVINLDAAQ